MYKNKGVPKGFVHDWTYRGHWHEKKIRPGLWRFRFRATKNRKADRMGSFGIGTKGAWKIKGTQYIRKTGRGKYQTDFIGTKRPLKFYIKSKKRKW